MSSESPHRHPSPVREGAPRCCRYCEAREASKTAALWDAAPELSSLLTPGILPANLGYHLGDRTLHVELWREWRRMLEGLRHVGLVLAMTRSAAASIGRTAIFPDLDWSGDGRHAVDDDGGFDFDLRFWHHATAVHQRSDAGHCFAVEFSDAGGHCFHRVCLSGDSELEEFAAWVRLHQALNGSMSGEVTDDLDAIETPRDPIGPGASTCTTAEAIDHLLHECHSHELPVRAVVGSSGAVQGHRILPSSLTTSDGWTFCRNEEVALSYHTAGFARVMLHNLSPGPFECWSVKAYAADGSLALMLLPAGNDRLPMWNFLVRALG